MPEPPFVPNTVISSAAVNDDFSDIGTALTGSLARDGQGGMTDVLPMDPTGFVYTNDSNTGMERTGADAQAITCGGQDIVSITTAGINVVGSISQNGLTLLPVGLGPLPWAGATAPSGWLFCFGQSLLRATYPALFTAIGVLWGSADSTHFNVPDMRGRIPAGKDDMGGSAASRLTSTTMTPDGNSLGAVGGAQTVLIALTNLPDVDFDVTIPAGEGSHDHVQTAASAGGPTSLNAGGSGSGPSPTQSVTQTSTLPEMVGTAASGGDGSAVDKIQPTIITNYIIFAGA